MKKLFLRTISVVALGWLLWGVAGCQSPREGVPRPEGFMRIDRLDTLYRSFSPAFPLVFDIPSQALVVQDSLSPLWFNMAYPHYRATLWCSYHPLTVDNREQLYAEVRELVYVHASKASSITVQRYDDETLPLYAFLYRLAGQVATPLQFVLTDSASFLFRGALYFDVPARSDSVAPIVDYVADDVARMVETLQIVR